MYLQAGRGLIAAHSVGIIHRDFKADNVLVGKDGRARVADFGLARVLSQEPEPAPRHGEARSAPTVTQAGAIVGTPAYMSPEQHRSAQVDERSDQFSYCAALYEAIYEQRPFTGRTVDELALQVASGVVEPPPAERAAPGGLHRALLRGLDPDPAARWPSLAALLAELERFQGASEPSRERQRRAFAALLVALVLVVGSVELHRFGFASAPMSRTLLVAIAALVLGIGLAAAWSVRATLLVDPVHRRMIMIVLYAMATGLVSHSLGAMAGLPIETTALVEMIALTAGFGSIALFVMPAMWPIAALSLLGAAACAGLGLPAMLVSAAVDGCSVLLVARAWRRAATLE